MQTMKRWLLSALLLGASASAAHGNGGEVQLQSESEDPTRMDWRREGIGIVTHAVSSSKDTLYVGSEAGVVAALSKADGSVNWRRVLNGGAVDALALKLGIVISLSDNGRKIDFFKAKDGALKATGTTYEREGSGQLIGDGADSSSSSVGANTHVPANLHLFSVGDSSKAGDQRVAVVAHNGIFVHSLDGKRKWSFDGNTADPTSACNINSVVAGPNEVQVTCENSEMVYSLDSKLGGWTVVDNVATGDRTQNTVIPSGASAPALLPTASAAFVRAVANSAHQDRANVDVAAAFAGTDEDEVAVQLVDGGFAQVDSDGQLSFLREEGLSLVTQVVPVALDRQTAAQVSSTASQQLSGPSLGERLVSHAAILADFAASVPAELLAIIRGQPSSGASSVDRIGEKLVIALSQQGRVFALDSVTGTVRWSHLVASPAATTRILSASVEGGVQVLVVDENHLIRLDLLTGAERSRQAAGLSVDGAAVATILRIAMDPAKTAPSDAESTCGDDSAFATIAAHSDGSVSVVGSTHAASDVAAAMQDAGKLFFQHIDYQEGVVSGHALEVSEQGGLQARELWSLPLGDALADADQEPQSVLETCATVDAHEKIQVLGLPFANDGVLLKYLNPNMMACAVSHTATESVPASVDIVVLDTITGRSLYRISHENSAGPVQMVFSENFLVYSYSRIDNAARTEISSIALYESSLGTYDLLPWKPLGRKPSFSSFEEQMPVVLQKTFTYPEGILRLAVSETTQGVSEKAFLIHTSAGRVAFLRRDLLDPRRPDLTAPGAKADPSINLKPYHGHLAQIPTDVVSYHLDLRQSPTSPDNTHALASFPTKLESTAEVFLTGLDLFYARFAPSTTYDMLPEEFQKQIIIIVAVGVSTATAIAHRMAVQKNLKTVWK